MHLAAQGGGVDVHHAGVHGADVAEGAGKVAGVHGGGEAEFDAVGNGHGVVQVAGAEHGQHRPENFLAGNSHFRGDIGKDGGFNVPAFVVDAAGQGAAAVGQGGAFVPAGGDVFGHRPLLGGAGQGADINGFVHAVADGQAGSAVNEVFHKLVIDAVLNDDPAGGGAALAGGAEGALHDAAQGLVQVGVGQQDDGVFAAHFGLHLFEQRGAAGVKFGANLRAAGE